MRAQELTRRRNAMIVTRTDSRMVLPENAHDSLFSPATLRLGEIHWHVLRAANLMHTRRYKERKTGGDGFAKLERTDFGKEVGGDEINWWVFKRETDVRELGARTHVALESAQLLKQASVGLRNQIPESYVDLLSTLRAFAECHDAEILSLYEYVRWLETRDILAPSILFTFRIWGSTRMSDRWDGIDIASLEATKPAIIRQLAICGTSRKHSRCGGRGRIRRRGWQR